MITSNDLAHAVWDGPEDGKTIAMMRKYAATILDGEIQLTPEPYLFYMAPMILIHGGALKIDDKVRIPAMLACLKSI